MWSKPPDVVTVRPHWRFAWDKRPSSGAEPQVADLRSALLLVVLHRPLGPDLGVVGVQAGVAPGPALAEQVPALVELHPEVLEPGPVVVGELFAPVPFEVVFLGDEAVDVGHDLGIVHGSFYRTEPRSAARTPCVPAATLQVKARFTV